MCEEQKNVLNFLKDGRYLFSQHMVNMEMIKLDNSKCKRPKMLQTEQLSQGQCLLAEFERGHLPFLLCPKSSSYKPHDSISSLGFLWFILQDYSIVDLGLACRRQTLLSEERRTAKETQVAPNKLAVCWAFEK